MVVPVSNHDVPPRRLVAPNSELAITLVASIDGSFGYRFHGKSLGTCRSTYTYVFSSRSAPSGTALRHFYRLLPSCDYRKQETRIPARHVCLGLCSAGFAAMDALHVLLFCSVRGPKLRCVHL